ncbi:hypothetical protein BGZ51_007830 [Haplosporangium sp. Z 767]|nr:hypothetical protein BGZ51_007830 [Haplosporangium sp. Z 767]
MSSDWPEFQSSSTTTKAPEWTLRTESELHVERLGTVIPLPSQDLQEPNADEIQEGQEEADEGLWLLWNNKAMPSADPLTERSRIYNTQPSYGLNADRGQQPSESEDDDREEREDRLESAKARAKHIEEYTGSTQRACSRTCCCIIS